MNGINGFAEPLLVDWLAQLEPHWRLALFALAGMVAGLGLDVVIRRVPAAVERAWREEMQAADFVPTPFTTASAAATPSSPCTSGAHGLQRAAATHQSEHPCAALTPGAYLCEPGLAGSATAPHRRWQLSALAGMLSAAISWRFGPTWQSLGALALVWLLGSVAWRLLRGWRRDPPGILIISCLLLAYVLESYSDNMHFYLSFNWYFWFVMGTIYAWLERERMAAPQGARRRA